MSNELKQVTPSDPNAVVKTEITPHGIAPFHDGTGNVYQSVVVLGQRAEQIGAHLKEELNEKLAEFGTSSESLEEIVENREQIEIAKHYEQLPKPTLLAIEEFLKGQVYYKNDNPLGE
jgi:DNA-directed RNA polymerase subunit K/omega